MFLIHGDNQVASRKYLENQTKAFQGELVTLNGSKLTLTDLTQALESNSLFGSNRLVVIENLFSRPIGSDKKALLGYCFLHTPTNLIFWEAKTIDGRTLTKLKPNQQVCFKTSPLVFKFIESLSPGKSALAISLFHQALAQEPVEMIMYLLVRQIHNLLIAVKLGQPGLVHLGPWQQGKLLAQAKNFNFDQLAAIYHQLEELEYRQKTGKAYQDLASSLDVLLATTL